MRSTAPSTSPGSRRRFASDGRSSSETATPAATAASKPGGRALPHLVADAADVAKLLGGLGHPTRDLDDALVTDDPALGHVALDGLILSPRGDLARHCELPAVERGDPLDLAPLLFRHDLVGGGIGEAFEVGGQPLGPPAVGKLSGETPIHLGQVAHVVERVLDLRVGQRALGPIGVRVALVELDAEHLLDERTVADLLRKARQRRSDLRVEDGRGSQSTDPIEDLQVLASRVKHLGHRRVAQQVAQRREVVYRKRVDDGRHVIGPQLDQAQAREVGALAHELGVDAHDRGGSEPAHKLPKLPDIGDVHYCLLRIPVP